MNMETFFRQECLSQPEYVHFLAKPEKARAIIADLSAKVRAKLDNCADRAAFEQSLKAEIKNYLKFVRKAILEIV